MIARGVGAAHGGDIELAVDPNRHLSALCVEGPREVRPLVGGNDPAPSQVIIPKTEVDVLIEESEMQRAITARAGIAEHHFPAVEDARVNPRTHGEVALEAEAAI